MTTEATEAAPEKETSRVEAFSDGVFAIAITLLVLTLHVPDVRPGVSVARLAHELGNQWPAYLAFLTSFATILIMWTHHNAIFGMLYRTDLRLLVANGLLLLLVTAVPFPTALVATYLLSPAAPLAVAVYAASFAVGTIIYNLLWWSAVDGARLLKPTVARQQVKAFRLDYLLGFPPYLVAVAVAFWNPYVSVAVCPGLWALCAATARGPLPIMTQTRKART
jgi:uncharacterized membrane protein